MKSISLSPRDRAPAGGAAAVEGGHGVKTLRVCDTFRIPEKSITVTFKIDHALGGGRAVPGGPIHDKPFAFFSLLAMTAMFCLLNCLLTVPLPGQTWTKEPTTFRGVPFGSSEKDAIELWKATESLNSKEWDEKQARRVRAVEDNEYFRRFGGSELCPTCDDDGRVPLTNLDLGDGTLAHMDAVFYEGRFSAVTASLHSESYETISASLIARYGRPTSVAHSSVQNKMGARFPNERLLWSGPRMLVSLSRFDDTLETGSFKILTQHYYRALEHADKKRKKAGGKALD